MKTNIFIALIMLLTTVSAIGSNYIIPAERGYTRHADVPPGPLDVTASQERLEQLVTMLPDKPKGIGPTINDRQTWEQIAQSPAFAGIIEKAEKVPQGSSGTAQLEILVYAECVENKGRFIPKIQQTIEKICSKYTWVPRIHDHGASNRTGQEITVDLKACENAALLSSTYYWLGEKLPERTRQLIQQELKRRIFDPVRKHAPGNYHGGMFWIWRQNNWNAVCWSKVVLAAMSVLESKYERAFFLGAAEGSIHYFLDGFFDDGYCQEGPGYWNYGFGHFVKLSDIVYQATDGKIDWLADEKVAKVAMFGNRTEILPGVYPFIADCRQNPTPKQGMQNYISRKYSLGLKQCQKPLGPQAAEPNKPLNFVWAFPHGIQTPTPQYIEYQFDPYRDWYPQGQLLIARPGPDKKATAKIGVSIKGGDNGASHNHNDIGVFEVAIGNAKPLVDPGAPAYRGGQAFGPERYASQVLSSYGHSVPVVDWHLQMAGKKAHAKVVNTDFTDQKDTITLDLKGVYKVETLDMGDDTYSLQTVKKLERTFIYDRTGSGSLTIIDQVDYTRPAYFEIALMTLGRFEKQPDGSVIVTDQDQSLKIQFDTNGQPYTLIEKKINQPMRKATYRQPTRLALRLEKPVNSAIIKTYITPE